MKNFIKHYELTENKIIIEITLSNVPFTTELLPNTTDVLVRYLPSIFLNKCFNGNGLCFYDESQNTEVGHLFEHILLEYMCLAKIRYSRSVSFNGRTYWNKSLDGNFRIEIECATSDWTFFQFALRKSIFLMDLIFAQESGERVEKPYPFVSPYITHELGVITH